MADVVVTQKNIDAATPATYWMCAGEWFSIGSSESEAQAKQNYTDACAGNGKPVDDIVWV